MVIGKLKRHNSPGIELIPTELIKAGGTKILSEINKFIYCIWNIEELPEKWKSRSLHLFIRRVVKQVVVIIGAYHFCQLRTKFYPTSCCQD